MQASLNKRVASLEKRVGVAVDMHTEHLAHMANDIGMKAEARDFHRVTMQKLEHRMKLVEAKHRKGERSTPGLGHNFLRGSHSDKAAWQDEPRPEGGDTDEGKSVDTVPDEQACVASIIPFRGRGEHLGLFYRHMSKFLESPEAKRLCWSFYIVEQYDTELFNRGWLFNVGFAMAQRESRKFSCLVIQDLDTLPELGAGVDFGNCTVPTQLSSEIECYGWLPPYAYNAGGVVTMSGEHWHMINGFANAYEGWGGEDDDLRLRMQQLGLLRGSCGDFCNLTDRAFSPGQKNLIRRPPLGHGRFICLDEKSHTPRKHGDMASMQKKLREMEMGSDRWAFDGLSSLHFDLVQHQTRTFPNAEEGTTLHWVKAVPSLNLRFGPERVQLLLAEGACSAECEAAKRCAGTPSQLPLSISDLQLEVARAFGGCLADAGEKPLIAAESLGYWLINRHIMVTSLRGIRSSGAPEAERAAAVAAASWVLSETLREALSESVNGEPALVIRAVPVPRLDAALARLRSDPLRQQQPITSACVGIFRLDDPWLRSKHTVNVGSDDCEQRSWTHLASFKVLRHRRSPEDIPVCIGEADNVWTARVGPNLENCSGEALGVYWRHKDVFYTGAGAMGKEMCVRHKKEKGRHARWSRWQILPKENGHCGDRRDGYTTEFVFRSMEDLYRPPRLYLCAGAEEPGNRLRLELDCDLSSFSYAYAVLRAEFAGDASEVYCIGRSMLGDRISRGPNCTSTEPDVRWDHVGAFAVPKGASGPPWCLGKRVETAKPDPDHGGALAPAHSFTVSSRPQCSGQGYEHVMAFREVALAEMTQEHGLLSLRAT